MQRKLVKAPVAIIVYNRPDHTSKLLNRLARFKFEHLIFIADGPRTLADRDRCAEVRKLVQVDWGCEVDYVFSEVNLGCKNRVVSGLDYVFEKYESAIILEDDCIPADSFFEFCELMLDQYRNDERILMACGTVLVEQPRNPFSYFYAQIPHIWGWASWRNRWERYTKDVRTYDDFYKLVNIGKAFPESFCWHLCERLKSIEQGYLDTWDAQMTYLAVSQNLLAIFPNQNLIKNIGFDQFGTHTTEISVLADLEIGEFDKTVKHPSIVVPLRKADIDRMQLEGFMGNGASRFFKIITKRNGINQVVTKILKKLSINK